MGQDTHKSQVTAGWEFKSQAMLVVVQDVVGTMLHYLAGHNFFHTFASDKFKGNREVVGGLVLCSLLEHWDYICSLPVNTHFLFCFGGFVDEGHHLDQYIGKL